MNNTDDLISHSRARFDHVAAKRILKEKYEANMLFAYGGGMFKAGPELITTLMTCMGPFPAVILDLYGNPVKVIPEVLFEQAKQRWQEQMNAWLVEYEELSNKR